MRDVAYWPKTFLDEVEQSKVERGVSFWSLGGPSFLYRTPQTTIWIDPYFYGTPDDSVPDAYRATSIPIKPDEVRLADCIISTHDHVDHCHEGTLVPILDNTEAFCIGPK
ncbi:MAG: MBL fold metallo-hydrolase, partial [Anaerolineales bacterium]|nr:MBL fold metallo-hydrolase [Anaerolineales bacterium]